MKTVNPLTTFTPFCCIAVAMPRGQSTGMYDPAACMTLPQSAVNCRIAGAPCTIARRRHLIARSPEICCCIVHQRFWPSHPPPADGGARPGTRRGAPGGGGPARGGGTAAADPCCACSSRWTLSHGNPSSTKKNPRAISCFHHCRLCGPKYVAHQAHGRGAIFGQMQPHLDAAVFGCRCSCH